MADSTKQLACVQEVFGNPDLLGRIVGHLDNGSAADLVRVLRVSQAFFDASAERLCKRIEVPFYEFNATKPRGFYYDRDCISCNGEIPTRHETPAGCTAHRAMEPGSDWDFIERAPVNIRAWYPATSTMKRLYEHVRVVTVEHHDACDRLAETHPLPNVRTVIARGSRDDQCYPTKPVELCGFSPQHPFRLVLDDVCPGLICSSCTPAGLLSPNVDTLVIALDHEKPYLSCQPDTFPDHFNPRRIAILFEHMRAPRGHERLGKASNESEVALAPGDCNNPRSSLFYRLARFVLLMSNDASVFIVAADHLALNMQGLEEYDRSLANFRPKYPHHVPNTRPRKAREGTNEPNGLILPKGCRWEYDRGHERPDRWRDAEGKEHGVYKEMELSDGEGEEEEQSAKKEREDLASYRNACYGQNGKVQAASMPRDIKEELLPLATCLIEKRVAVIEMLVHRWIDAILDCRIPVKDWDEEKKKGKWRGREDFERHIFESRAKSRQKEVKNWYKTHSCDQNCEYGCSFPGIPISDDDFDDEFVIVKAEREAETDPEEAYWRRERKEKKPAKYIVTAKRWKDGQKYQMTRKEIETKRKEAHGKVRFITTFEYHKMEGNNDEMDDPSKYL
jgi:hypothetical protein